MANANVASLRSPTARSQGSSGHPVIPPPQTSPPKSPSHQARNNSGSASGPVNIKFAIAPQHNGQSPVSPPQRRGGQPGPPAVSPMLRPVGMRSPPKPIGTARTPSELRLNRLFESSLKSVSAHPQQRTNSSAERDRRQVGCCDIVNDESGNRITSPRKRSPSRSSKESKSAIGKKGNTKVIRGERAAPILKSMDNGTGPSEDGVIRVRPMTPKCDFDDIGWGSPSRNTALKVRSIDRDISFPTTDFDNDPFADVFQTPTREARFVSSNSPRNNRKLLPSLGSKRKSNPSRSDTGMAKSHLVHLENKGLDLLDRETTRQTSTGNGSVYGYEEVNGSPYTLPAALNSPLKQGFRPNSLCKSKRRGSLGDFSASGRTKGHLRERRASMDMLPSTKRSPADLPMCDDGRMPAQSRSLSRKDQRNAGSVGEDEHILLKSPRKQRRSTMQFTSEFSDSNGSSSPHRQSAQHASALDSPASYVPLAPVFPESVKRNSTKTCRRASLDNSRPVSTQLTHPHDFSESLKKNSTKTSRRASLDNFRPVSTPLPTDETHALSVQQRQKCTTRARRRASLTHDNQRCSAPCHNVDAPGAVTRSRYPRRSSMGGVVIPF